MRTAAATLLGAGLLAFLPSSPAAANNAPARSIDNACPPGQVPDGNFSDDPAGDNNPATESVAEATVRAADCIKAYGIASGTTATTYGYTSNVSRGQMASFIMNKLSKVTGFTMPQNPPNAFTDDDGQTHEQNTNRGAAADVVNGVTGDRCNDTLANRNTPDGQTPDFCPGVDVNRGQMATFIVNELRAAGVTIPQPQGAFPFSDVPQDNVHRTNIHILHDLGIFVGNPDGTFRPGDPISRGQMALVMARNVALLVEQGKMAPLGATGSNQSFAVSPTSTQIRDDSEVAQYTFSGLDPQKRYDVALVPCGEDDYGTIVYSNGQPFINRAGASATGGLISFADESGGGGGEPDDLPDFWGTTQNGFADITLINLTNQGGQLPGDQVNEVTPRANGTIDIVMAVPAGEADCAIPVVWEEATSGTTDDDILNLKDNNAATLENDNTPITAEPFRVGPAAVWFVSHAPNGSEPNNEVLFRGAASLFGTTLGNDTIGVVLEDGFLYGLSTSDQYFYNGAEVEGPISATNALNWLNIGDNSFATCDGDSACTSIDRPYSQGGTNAFFFDFDENSYTPPTNVVATVGNFEGANGNNDLRITWTAPVYDGAPSADVDEYCYEVRSTAAGAAGTVVTTDCTDEVNSLDATGDAPTTTQTDTIDAADLGPGTYIVRVFAESETDDESQYSLFSAPVTIVAVGAPRSTLTSSSDNDNSGTVTAGDVLTVKFDQAMNTTNTGDSITLQDANGTVCTYTQGSGGTNFVYGDTDAAIPGAETVAITVGTPANCAAAGTTGGMQFPATVTNQANIVDADSGFGWDIANSPDKTFE
jgi:hypothetical protein